MEKMRYWQQLQSTAANPDGGWGDSTAASVWESWQRITLAIEAFAAACADMMLPVKRVTRQAYRRPVSQSTVQPRAFWLELARRRDVEKATRRQPSWA